MQKIFTPHRLFAIITVITGLAAFISGIAQVLPGAWPNYALAASGLLLKALTVIKFLDGNSKWELSPAGQASAAPVVDLAPVGAQEPSDVAGADSTLAPPSA